jgi:hypothetical protein
MFTKLKEPFGKAGLIVAVVALVAALAGGAYAANATDSGKRNKRGNAGAAQAKKYSKIFSKRFSKAFSKRFAVPGPAGPQGPKGDKGNNGSNGTNGTDGKNGSNGSNGTSVTVAGTPTAGECPAGGVKYHSASGNNSVCNGTFSTEPLPQNQTLKGAWGTSGAGEGGAEAGISLVQISFPIPVTSALTALWQFEPSPGVLVGVELKDGEFGYYEGGEQAPYEAACPGNADEPEASPGFLCIYPGTKEGTVGAPQESPSLIEAANDFGLVVPFQPVGEGSWRGSWAVTAG